MQSPIFITLVVFMAAFCGATTVHRWESSEHIQPPQHFMKHFQVVGDVLDEKLVPLTIVLKHRNNDLMEQLFWEVSDPQSPKYRQFLAQHEIRDMFGADDATIAEFTSFLSATHRATNIDVSPQHDMISCIMKAGEVERLLGTEVVRFESRRSSLIKTRHAAFPKNSFPATLKKHIAALAGVAQFPADFHSGNGVRSSVHFAKSEFSHLAHQTSKTESSFQMGATYPVVDPSPCVQCQTQSGDKSVIIALAPDCYGSFNGTWSGSSTSGFICNYNSGSNQYKFTLGTSVNVSWIVQAGGLNGNAGEAGITSPSNVLVNDQGAGAVVFPVMQFSIPLAYNWALYVANVTYSLIYDDGTVGFRTFMFTTPIRPAVPLNIEFVNSHYGLIKPLRLAHPRNGKAIGTLEVMFGPGNFNPKDVSRFGRANGLPNNTADFLGFTCVSNNDATNPDGETSLDVQWINGIAPCGSSVVSKATFAESDFLTVCKRLQNAMNIGLAVTTLSFSYGGSESYWAANMPDMLKSVDNQFKTLGLQGVSIFVSSGDQGACGSSPDGSSLLNPSWPATSPYVTSVGATQFFLSNRSATPAGWTEIVSSTEVGALITSGGGFSTYYAQPSYQNTSVATYLTSCAASLPSASLFNKNNRAYPDISAFGTSIQIYQQGQSTSVDGTSASAPMLAGFFSLMNDALLSSGAKPLGFLNPFLYQLKASDPAIFNDITSGSNRGLEVGMHPLVCSAGYGACTGFDAATGLGSLNFDKLLIKLVGSYNYSASFNYNDGSLCPIVAPLPPSEVVAVDIGGNTLAIPTSAPVFNGGASRSDQLSYIYYIQSSAVGALNHTIVASAPDSNAANIVTVAQFGGLPALTYTVTVSASNSAGKSNSTVGVSATVSNSSGSSDSGWPVWEIIAVAVGVAVGVAILIALIVHCCRKRNAGLLTAEQTDGGYASYGAYNQNLIDGRN